jgi:hypothetical protein
LKKKLLLLLTYFSVLNSFSQQSQYYVSRGQMNTKVGFSPGMLPKEFAIENILTLVKQPFMKNLIFFAFIFIKTQFFGQLKDFDGNIYTYINIGNQAWMGENLKVKHFNNGDLIPEAKTDEEWKAAFQKKTPAFRKFKITNDCNCERSVG